MALEEDAGIIGCKVTTSFFTFTELQQHYPSTWRRVQGGANWTGNPFHADNCPVICHCFVFLQHHTPLNWDQSTRMWKVAKDARTTEGKVRLWQVDPSLNIVITISMSLLHKWREWTVLFMWTSAFLQLGIWNIELSLEFGRRTNRRLVMWELSEKELREDWPLTGSCPLGSKALKSGQPTYRQYCGS